MGIRFDKVTYVYGTGGADEQLGLDCVDLDMDEGGFVAVLGESGSGKSTLLQHFNAILRPAKGRIRILDFEIRAGESLAQAGKLRKRVGVVFQFPEQQLFEETVEKDLIFGPRNFGASEEEAKAAARNAMEVMGLHEDILKQNPFQLSGGQMRKAAIAAVLASDPDVFVLDEPTASLDPASREELMQLLHRLCTEGKKTIIVVTHRLEEVLPYANDLIVMLRGKIAFHGSVRELLDKEPLLEEAGLVVPAQIRMVRKLAERFHITFSNADLNAEAIAEAVCRSIAIPPEKRDIREVGPV